MGSRAVIVVEVGSQDSLQVDLVENDDPIQALATDGSDHAFAIWILPRRSRRDWHFVDTQVLDACPEGVSVGVVAVSDHVSRSFVEWKRVHYLLSRPLGRGIGRDVEVNHASTIVAKDDETVQHAEGGGRYTENVDADQVLDMVVQERAPRLRRGLSMTNHVLRHRALGDVVPQ